MITMDVKRKTMLNEREAESCYLGQFIPLHYHHNMLMDSNRMLAFKTAIKHVVFPGAKVLELGGGTGVLSWFAAEQADKVWCVEFNPDMVNEATRLLAQNPYGEKVEVIHADAFEYLPPEPVDIVICEMIHVAMLREKLLEVIANFKQRYLEKFGGPLPIFMPEAVIMAVQPMQQEYCFEGYSAPIVQFQETHAIYAGSVQMAEPAVYSIIDLSAPIDMLISWQGSFCMTKDGNLNALRFITKNILSVVQQQNTSIDWLNHYMVLPLPSAVQVKAGDIIDVSLRYRGGASIASLQNALQAVIRQPESHTIRGEAVFA